MRFIGVDVKAINQAAEDGERIVVVVQGRALVFERYTADTTGMKIWSDEWATAYDFYHADTIEAIYIVSRRVTPAE